MSNLAVRDRKKMMYNLLDLEVYYDRQLHNVGHIVQEVVGVERELAKLFAGILPDINYHICASFRISKDSYGSLSFKLGDTGQKNSVSGTIYWDISCLIFKRLEEELLGV